MLAEVYYSPSEGLSDASPQPAGGRSGRRAGSIHAPKPGNISRSDDSALAHVVEGVVLEARRPRGCNNGFQSRDRSLTVGSYVV